MVEPKCPSCNVQGLDKIVSRDSAEMSLSGNSFFCIAQCADCGHVYGVFAKSVVVGNPSLNALSKAVAAHEMTPHQEIAPE